jgi:hypothetical protein
LSARRSEIGRFRRLRRRSIHSHDEGRDPVDPFPTLLPMLRRAE